MDTLRVGCKRGPVTSPGCRVTKSIPFSFAYFQAASSAKIFETKYQSWKRKTEHNKHIGNLIVNMIYTSQLTSRKNKNILHFSIFIRFKVK